MSAYEDERAARIARNKQMLLSLGIDKKIISPKKRAWARQKPTGPPRRSSRVEVAEKAKAHAVLQDRYEAALLAKESMSEHSRRYRAAERYVEELKHELATFDTSYTRSTSPPPAKKAKANTTVISDSSDDDESAISISDNSDHNQSDDESEVEVYVPTKRRKLPPADDVLQNVPVLDMIIPSKGQTKSVKEVALTLPDDKHVGCALAPRGKKPLLAWLCPGYTPTFSLMDGHQVLLNGMVLFMNVDMDDRYVNIFAKNETTNAITVTWFARKSIHTNHVVAQQLIHGVQADATSELQTHTKPTLLFFRFHPEGSYIYAGRLAYVGHKGDAPIQFEFELQDAAHLCDDLVKLMLGS
ncbi:hypothetical protein, variant [Saprolegnia diclina VS20]|uniref:Uncharacterized protein n=1 Tax=Saprolegnia diclina (strain VS20) TaxID=1156394 RepID=T0RNX3_SAPDV|nr:hypothetical protein, variant [Saprolegnia diclina VS20]EQC34093.1 hypothetical protein, variant [Saprolegnia diclina VS20]|eukprot:XP_008612405.1 hypothetical protein, variant [Saprolegnia diclina VS20]